MRSPIVTKDISVSHRNYSLFLVQDNHKGDKNSVKDTLEDVNNKLFASCKAKSRSYERLYYLLIGISLFFLFFLLLPYVAIQEEHINFQENMKASEHLLIPQFRSMNASLTAQNAYQNLIENISRSPQNLQNFVESTSDSSTNQLVYCPFEITGTYRNITQCSIETVQNMFESYLVDFMENVVEPLLSIYSNGPK